MEAKSGLYEVVRVFTVLNWAATWGRRGRKMKLDCIKDNILKGMAGIKNADGYDQR